MQRSGRRIAHRQMIMFRATRDVLAVAAGLSADPERWRRRLEELVVRVAGRSHGWSRSGEYGPDAGRRRDRRPEAGRSEYRPWPPRSGPMPDRALRGHEPSGVMNTVAPVPPSRRPPSADPADPAESPAEFAAAAAPSRRIRRTVRSCSRDRRITTAASATRRAARQRWRIESCRGLRQGLRCTSHHRRGAGPSGRAHATRPRLP